ncbi:MAG TPA: DoxX family protein [Candidatus Paceibacterota bacterium]|nr:DoxX family protein [Candidatus Paceibacterota bacterium]
MEYLFLLSRILFGGYFLWNGYKHFKHTANLAGYAASKKVPSPQLMVRLSGALLLIGGVGIVLGAAVGLAVSALVAFLIPVTFMMHDYWKETDPVQRAHQQIAFAKNIALLGAAFAYLFIPGPWFLAI